MTHHGQDPLTTEGVVKALSLAVEVFDETHPDLSTFLSITMSHIKNLQKELDSRKEYEAKYNQMKAAYLANKGKF